MTDYQALAERLEAHANSGYGVVYDGIALAADLRTAAQLARGRAEAPEPVAWMFPRRYGSGLSFVRPADYFDELTESMVTPTPLFTHPPAPQPAAQPGFLRQIEASRENVRAWPQWMQDATVESAATMPKWPAPQPQPERQPESEPTRWKVGNELAPYHPDASHVEPGYRDGWNACYRAMRESEPTEAQIECHGLDTPERVCFYEQDFYVLSNFSSFSVQWRGHRYPTSEHVYHVEKFRNYRGDIADMIAFAPSAHEAFKIAERHKADRRPDWDEIKVEVMREILRAKAMQHEYVRRKLLATGDRELVENSWRDDFWGWGPNRNGQNMLGKLWMEVRAELRAALAARESK